MDTIAFIKNNRKTSLENIRDIVKNTLYELQEKSIAITPDNYFIEFYKQVKKLGIEYKEHALFNEVLDEMSNNKNNSEEVYNSFIFKLLTF